jgi:hypothetical protein
MILTKPPYWRVAERSSASWPSSSSKPWALARSRRRHVGAGARARDRAPRPPFTLCGDACAVERVPPACTCTYTEYLAEFDFRYNNRIALGVDDAARTTKVLSCAGIEPAFEPRARQKADASSRSMEKAAHPSRTPAFVSETRIPQGFPRHF